MRRLLGPGSDLLGSLGGFGAALPLPVGYREPVLVTATDGIGTKTEIARLLGRHDTIGADLVAMCADDVVCHGALPIWFLDYLVVGKLTPRMVTGIVGGVAAACREIGCELVGGETAEHPGLMAPDAFDLAGFCVGIVERSALIDGSRAQAGDAVVGLASSGLHANGYSLVRMLIEREGLDLATPFRALIPSMARRGGVEASHEPTLGEILLTPTRLYARTILRIREEVERQGARLGGIAHVTGGGLPGNLPRAVHSGLAVEVDPKAWPEPDVVQLLGRLGGMDGPQRRQTFNAGIGMALVVERGAEMAAVERARTLGVDAWVIGRVLPAEDAGPSRYVERPP